MNKNPHQLHALQAHALPGLPPFDPDDLMVLAEYFRGGPRAVTIHAPSRSVEVTDCHKPVRLSIARWLHMTVSWRDHMMGKLVFMNGNRGVHGYDYRPTVRIAIRRGGPKYSITVSKWIREQLFPASGRKPFFIDGDRRNLMESNVIPCPYVSLFPGVIQDTTDNPLQYVWKGVDARTEKEYVSTSESALYELMAAECVMVKPTLKNVRGEAPVDARVEWELIQARAQALDALWGTERGVDGWFSKPGRLQHGLELV